MPILHALRQFFCLITSWLVHGLTFVFCSLRFSTPSQELPVTSQQFPVGSQGALKQPNLSPSALLQIRLNERDAKKTTHAKKSKPHDLNGSPLDAVGNIEPQISVDGALSEVADSLKSCPLSPDPYVHFTPFSSSQPTHSLTSPCPSLKPTQHQHGEQVFSIGHSGVEIGDLGKRRGFKGAPLFTQSTRKSPSFLSLPTYSPRSGSPSFAQNAIPRSFSSGPRSPFATVTNLMRTTSPKLPGPINEVSPDLQDFYDEADPFFGHGETFFTPSFSSATVSTANLDNFAPYYRHQPTHRRMLPLKRKVSYDDLRSRASSMNKVLMKTTIYDMTVSVSIISAVTPATIQKRNIKRPTHPPISTACLSPKIMLTSPSAPSSPTKTVCSVVDMVPIDLPVVQESFARLRVSAKHNRSSKVKTRLEDENSFVFDPFSSAPGPVLNLHDLGAYDASLKNSPTQFKPSLDPTDGPAVTSTQTPENTLTGVTLPDSKNNQDDIDADPGLSFPVFVTLANFYDFGAYGSSSKDTSPSLRKKSTHPDLRDATPTKLRKHSIVELDTNVYDLSIYGDRPGLETCSLGSALCLAEPRLEELDMYKPHTLSKQVSQLCPVVLPIRGASCESSTSTVSTDDDHCPSDMGNAITDCHSRGLNEIIAQLDCAWAKGANLEEEVPGNIGGIYASYAM